MAHSARYEARLDAAWQELIGTADALCAELKTARPTARRKALAATARTLRARQAGGSGSVPVVGVVA